MRMEIKGKSPVILFGFVLLLALSGFCLFVSGFAVYAGETPESYFENLEKLKESQVWYGGWVPIVIPDSAKDIHEVHNLDNNRVQLAFSFSEEDRFYENDGFTTILPSEITTMQKFWDYEWWDTSHIINECTFFQWNGKSATSNYSGFWGIDEINHKAYFWDNQVKERIF